MSNSLQKNQAGVGIVGVLLVMLVVALIAFVGYRVYSSQQPSVEDATNNSVTQVDEIKDEQDLKEAENMLEEANLEELDTSELDAAEAELL